MAIAASPTRVFVVSAVLFFLVMGRSFSWKTPTKTIAVKKPKLAYALPAAIQPSMSLSHFKKELELTAQDLALWNKGVLVPDWNKGLLIADESPQQLGNWMEEAGIKNTRENRQQFNSIRFDAPSLKHYISGVVLHEATLALGPGGREGRERCADGGSVADHLLGRGVRLGVRLDRGLQPLAGGAPGDTFTVGYDTLRRTAKRAYAAGARFATWEAVFRIVPIEEEEEVMHSIWPTDVRFMGNTGLAMLENSAALARFARAAQEEGLVPVLSPRLVFGHLPFAHQRHHVYGNALERVLDRVFSACQAYGVHLEGCLLQLAPVVPPPESWGSTVDAASAAPAFAGAASQLAPLAPPLEGRDPALDATFATVAGAAATQHALEKRAPAALPGVLLLSDRQGLGALPTVEQIREISLVRQAAQGGPFENRLGFSMGESIQKELIEAWLGRPENVAHAQTLLLERAELLSGALDDELAARSFPSSFGGGSV